MKTVRRLLSREIFQAVGFVALAFLALFVFFDLVDELQDITYLSARGYKLEHAMVVVASRIPGHLYDLLPISVLIGSIFVMARFAQSSEFTILRTGGLSPARTLSLLLRMGWIFVGLTLLLGDYAAPWAEQQGILLKSRYQGDLTAGATGAWLKERQEGQQMAINIRALDNQSRMQGVRIQTFDAQGRMLSTLVAAHGEFDESGWWLSQVNITELKTQAGQSALVKRSQDRMLWPTGISRDMVAASIISAESMKIWDLVLYTRHLSANNQNAQIYEIQLWRKVFYPLSCLVMLTLALPFAYLHFRSGQIAGHVFGGVMAGISFYLLNNVFNHIGNLRNWEPWITSASPSLIYMVISLAAFGWMVLRR